MTREAAEGLVSLMLRLRGYGINDARFLKALEATPRDRFVHPDYFADTWSEQTLPIGCGQTIPPPDVTARMIHALNVHPSHSVLEIGTGTGFQTALLSAIGKKVHTIDRYKSLIAGAQKTISTLGLSNISYEHADGADGGRVAGLYDRVIADFAYPEMPRQLIDKVASNGIVVAAIGPPCAEQMAVKLIKIGSRFERQDLFPVRLGSPETGVALAL